MKTVITGAAGFIGANLVRALLKDRRDIRAVDNVSRGSKKNLEGLPIETVHADLRDWCQARQAIEGADVVYHLAARVGSIDFLHGSKESELSALQANLAIDNNVFRACIEFDVKKVIYASSVSVYPIHKQQELNAKFKEEDIYPIDPEGGYGWAKLMGEIQLGMMGKCKSAVARIFNAYGEYCEYGETAQVVPALIRKAINYPREDFVVWGDGSQTRNLLYIGDCIDALLRMEKNATYPPLILNVGNERTVTIQQLAEIVIKASGKCIKPKFDTSARVGPVSRIPDITRAKEAIGWVPSVSVEEGVKKTFRWMSTELTNSSGMKPARPGRNF